VPLKAALLPMLMRARRAAKTVTTRMEMTGMVLRLSICGVLVEGSQVVCRSKGVLTMLRAREKGSPRSRANDHVMRDAAARHPIALQNSSRTIIATMTVAPASEPTACVKMRRKGAVVAFWSLSKSVILWALKRTAKSIPNANVPLMTRLRSIERGTSVLAFFTSSDI